MHENMHGIKPNLTGFGNLSGLIAEVKAIALI